MERTVKRPARWDEPFGPRMTDVDVDRIMRLPPFASMDEARFPSSQPLRDILRFDARIVTVRPGDIVMREGDYGHSAFLILRGRMRVVLDSLPASILGRRDHPRQKWWRNLARLFPTRRYPEQRERSAVRFDAQIALRHEDEAPCIFLQDIPRVLGQYRTATLVPGEYFGETSAMSRGPRAATVLADEDGALLEIRWQGLRDLMRREPEFRASMEQLYRRNSLEAQIHETPFLKHLPDDVVQQIAAVTEFESFGEFEWHRPFQRLQEESPNERIHSEPLIAEEGHYLDGLILIRGGFARLSHKYGNGHRTLSYLGKGQAYGLETLYANWRNGTQEPPPSSLRAVGYVDILRIPTRTLEELVFPRSPAGMWARWTQSALPDENTRTRKSEHPRSEKTLSTSLVEFILDHRLMNGTQAMIIDTDRCTRCDDCVRACAQAHDGNPRFVRQGPQHGRFQFAQACMHCLDPVCMIGCPTGAIARDPATGDVLINDLTCIGCSTCAQSCPYQNIRMVEVRDANGEFLIADDLQLPIVKATKCDLCTDLWGGPACQRACPHDALVRIDMNDRERLADWIGSRTAS